MERTSKETVGQTTFSVTNTIREGDPYIDFVWLREDDRTGEVYENKDSPVDGGISVEFAETLIGELQKAIAYLREEH